MLRRLHSEQPDSFAFTPENAAWADGQIKKYPEGRQASAVIPLLWRAQEQEGWVTKPMIETVAGMLDMADIRVLEVASFYFMFHLAPVGSVAHIQVCGTTSCMLCGAEDLVAVCKEKIAPAPHMLSADGKLSWEEVECLGACANAPMAQIGKDYYEDLTVASFSAIVDALADGKVPTPGSQTGRWASEPVSGRTSLAGDPHHDANASIDLAATQGDTIARITGSQPPMPLSTIVIPDTPPEPAPKPVAEAPKAAKPKAKAKPKPAPEPEPEPEPAAAEPAPASDAPVFLDAARAGGPDDLKKIKGVGPKLEEKLHALGVFHFDQIAGWTAEQIAEVDDKLSFKGRIERDEWIAQAKALMEEQS